MRVEFGPRLRIDTELQRDFTYVTDIVDGVGTGGCSPTCEFTVSRHGEPIGRTTLPMLGRFNIRNALAAIAAASYAGVPFHDACSGLASFRGVKRRQEIIGNIDGILLIDDFAHHPTAVGETLSGLRSAHGDRRIWAIFEPASATNARRPRWCPRCPR